MVVWAYKKQAWITYGGRGKRKRALDYFWITFGLLLDYFWITFRLASGTHGKCIENDSKIHPKTMLEYFWITFGLLLDYFWYTFWYVSFGRDILKNIAGLILEYFWNTFGLLSVYFN